MTTRGAGIAGLCLLAGIVLSAGFSARAGSSPDRLDKQIGIFERVMDHMLVESPNLLVQSRDSVQGTYIDGYGAMFTFKVSLNSRRWDGRWGWIGGDDVHVIIVDDEDHEILSDGELREWELKEQERLYADGKREIVETLRDFGEVLASLDDADRIEIRVRFRGAAYFKENGLRKLTVSVKMSDVRAYAAGDLGADRFADRVRIEES
jgi:hypothetical protein